MTEKSHIKYESGVRNFVKKHFPRTYVQPAGISLISKLLNSLNNRVVDEFKSESNKKSSSFQQSAQLAVEKVFGNELKAPAISEAHRQVAMFEMGLIHYSDGSGIKRMKMGAKPTKFRRKQVKKKMHSQDYPSVVFRSGITRLHTCSRSPLSLDGTAKEFLSQSLHHFTRLVANKVKEKYSTKEELQPLDIRNVLPEYFGQNVMKSANSEGNKCLVLYENDLLLFKPKKGISRFEIMSSQGAIPVIKKAIGHGIKSFVGGFTNKSAIHSKSSQYVEHILLRVLTHLTTKIGDDAHSGHLSEITEAQVKKAVVNLLPKELRQHALVQGSAAIDGYKSGTLEWDPPKKKKKHSLKKSKSGRQSKYRHRKQEQDPSRRKTKMKKHRKSSKPSRKRSSSPYGNKLRSRKRMKLSGDEDGGPKDRAKYKYSSKNKSRLRKRTKPSADKYTGSKDKAKYKSSSKNKARRIKRIKPSADKDAGSKGRAKSSSKNKTRLRKRIKPTDKEAGSKDPTKSKTSPKTTLNFGSILTSFVSDVFPGLHVLLPRDVATEIGGILESVCKRLVNDCNLGFWGGNEVGVEVVRNACNGLFPVEMAQHAVSFGTNVIMLRSGESEFDLSQGVTPEVPQSQ